MDHPSATVRRLHALAAGLTFAALALALALALSMPASAQHTARAAAQAAPAPTGYKIGRTPQWVHPVRPSTGTPPTPGPGPGYRIALMDMQTLLGPGGTEQAYTRMRNVVLEAAGLQAVSKPEIYFNPAYQTVTLHEAAVLRNGTRLDRLKGARIETLRREEGLERLTLTGVQTLLVLLHDVRVGDTVEVAYTVHGSNPIFKGHHAETYQLAHMAAIDELHLRIEAPASRTLHTRGIRSDAAPERHVQGNRQELRLVRRNVPAIVPEEHTPPWFKVFPALHVSDYADWREVATWAQELFAQPGEPGPELLSRIEAWRAQGLTREQLASEVVAFVQDEVRYFSVSLGESSHRPKPPARTLAERLGDCKDKVALLNTILQRLGYDAQPALVSMRRTRGIADYLPAHDQFDHVITRLVLDGRTHWLDPTIPLQGRTLQGRGVPPYGMALVVAPATTALTRIEPASAQSQRVEWESVWDASDLKRHPRLTTTLRAHGLAAEGWRHSANAGGAERLASAVAGAYARLFPKLRATGTAALRDDRDTNVFEIEMQHEAPGLGRYERGVLPMELPALELLDTLTGPREARREMPFLVEQPALLRQRVRVVAPRRFGQRTPPPNEVADKHFRLTSRYEVQGHSFDYVLTYERRSDEVLPADLHGFRERVQAARRLAGVSVRLPLLDFEALRPAYADIEQRLDRRLGRQSDALRDIVARQEVERLFATELLAANGDDGPLAAQLYRERAIAHSMLGDFEATLADAERSLAADPEDGYSHYTRGLALIAMGRPAEAEAAMRQYQNPTQRSLVTGGIGRALFYRGEYAQAERTLREAVQAASGDDRVFGTAWLFLAAERAGGKGREAIAPYLADIERLGWPGVVVHHLAGSASQDELLEVARRDPRMARLNLAEAHFYAGQRLLLDGRTSDARRMFQRTLDSRATPYLEHTWAELELKRTAAP